MAPTILCLGEILLDCLADQIGKPYDAVESWTAYPGGAPANVACGLVKLGTSAGFIGCIGDDKPGHQLSQVLQEVGVDISGVQRHPHAPTRQVYVVRREDGDREFAGFGGLNSADFADTRLDARQIPESLFMEAEYLVMGTLELAYSPCQEAIAHCRDLAQQHGVQVLIDVNWRPVFWQDVESAKATIRKAIADVDLLKLAEEEADFLFNTQGVTEVATQLPGVNRLIITRGDRGCSYCFGDVVGDIEAFPVTVQDTTGAGDGFVAGFLHQLQKHGVDALHDPENARNIMTYASAVGALTATKPGAIAAQPTAEEVQQFYLVERGERKGC
ncbi:carbohydrate kinase [Phormidium yuhuli AB48]|uniref:Carbohydrate kinase n=1 Tax=Phormidium yuhuli AB48 TaxID=2940671 RepID=A0ABY5AKL7_9CYAN|nr:carbohydrate kinase [Phormidium yuhuli]USR89316.1 carbohydrate kinase [Phormidium yuhuli AB48]